MKFTFGLLVGALAASALPNPTPAHEGAHQQVARCSTNAECLKRGLPLLPATPVHAKRQATVSGSPQPTGIIEILSGATGANLALLGYVKQIASGDSVYRITTSKDLAARVIAPPPTNPLDRGNLVSSSDTAFPFICGVPAFGSSGNMVPGTNDYLSLTACSSSSPSGSPPTQGDNRLLAQNPTEQAYQERETAVWKVPAIDSPDFITFRWVNRATASAPNTDDDTFTVLAPRGGNGEGTILYVASDPTNFPPANIFTPAVPVFFRFISA